jgi:hypothetical protein
MPRNAMPGVATARAALHGAVEAVRRYAGHADPRAALANSVALVVASNQPFYPLYLYWAVSPTVWPSYASFLSTPLFLAVPALARRNALLGRSTLLVAGLGNTLVCRAMFGAGSGVDVFLFPCIALALLLFPRTERLLAFGFVAAAFAICLIPEGSIIALPHRYGPSEYAAFQRLNFLSAAALTALIALLAANAWEDDRRGDETGQA